MTQMFSKYGDISTIAIEALVMKISFQVYCYKCIVINDIFRTIFTFHI